MYRVSRHTALYSFNKIVWIYLDRIVHLHKIHRSMPLYPFIGSGKTLHGTYEQTLFGWAQVAKFSRKQKHFSNFKLMMISLMDSVQCSMVISIFGLSVSFFFSIFLTVNSNVIRPLINCFDGGTRNHFEDIGLSDYLITDYWILWLGRRLCLIFWNEIRIAFVQSAWNKDALRIGANMRIDFYWRCGSNFFHESQAQNITETKHCFIQLLARIWKKLNKKHSFKCICQLLILFDRNLFAFCAPVRNIYPKFWPRKCFLLRFKCLFWEFKHQKNQ